MGVRTVDVARATGGWRVWLTFEHTKNIVFRQSTLSRFIIQRWPVRTVQLYGFTLYLGPGWPTVARVGGGGQWAVEGARW